MWHGVHVHVHVCDVCMMCVRDCCANRCARAGPGVGWLNIRSGHPGLGLACEIQDLDYVDFGIQDLDYADYEIQELDYADFERTELDLADFKGAELDLADRRGAWSSCEIEIVGDIMGD